MCPGSPAISTATGSDAVPDQAADSTTIPVYSRRSYNSYLRGTGAGRLSTPFDAGLRAVHLPAPGDRFRRVLPEEAEPAGASRPSSPRPPLTSSGARCTLVPAVRCGQRLLGQVSIRWISAVLPPGRRSSCNTLTGAIPPPAVDGTDIRSIFAGVGWDLTVADGGSISLPPALSTSHAHQGMVREEPPPPHAVGPGV